MNLYFFFFFSSRRRHTRSLRDWSSDVCSSDLRPAGGGAHGAARRRPAHRHDLARRDRRQLSLPQRPQAVRLGGAHPSGAQPRPQGPPRPHHQAGLGVGALDPPGKPPNEPRPSRRSPAPTPRSPTAAAPRSPPSRSPASCWPAAFTSSPSWRNRPPRRPPPGALALPHEPATRPLS